jgi:hypothetical protein
VAEEYSSLEIFSKFAILSSSRIDHSISLAGSSQNASRDGSLGHFAHQSRPPVV